MLSVSVEKFTVMSVEITIADIKICALSPVETLLIKSSHHFIKSLLQPGD